MISISENHIFLDIDITSKGDVRLLHLSSKPMDNQIPDIQQRWYRLAEMQFSGFDQNDHHGSKHTGCNPSKSMTYLTHKEYRTAFGRKLELTQEYQGIQLTSHYQFFDGISVIKCWNEAVNMSDEDYTLEYLSSFALTGLSAHSSLIRDQGCKIWLPHNTWFGEAGWKDYTLNELGYQVVNYFSMKRIALTGIGTWPASEFLPMGSFEHYERNETITWQIESSGAWHWEISDIAGVLYLQASGPAYQEHHFAKHLAPGERFESVPCTVAIVQGDFQKSIQELTKYRRRIRRPNEDNDKLPVIFNDYMNCLMGNPTTDTLKPLIDAAGEIGCEYFCVDCGWYSDGPWWDSVGEWMPSLKRFPGGIKEVLAYIRSKGMIPGLWLEIEVMGISCPLAEQVPENWFFIRNGKRVIDHNRYQLDFRNEEVRSYAGRVVQRLVEEYEVGYIKMDYNINGGPGTAYQSDSVGEGLLSHTRAYVQWLDEIFVKYPELIIENCSSGGMRMVYPLLSRHSIQSVSDQMDYVKMAVIAANCPTACPPEQAAVWSYPLEGNDEEETIFNMVNAILFRIHQSGYLNRISHERLEYIKEGIHYYKKIRKNIKTALPFWPTGIADYSSEYVSIGLACKEKCYVAVWRTRNGEEEYITLKTNEEMGEHVCCGYPEKKGVRYHVTENGIRVYLEPKTARILEIS